MAYTGSFGCLSKATLVGLRHDLPTPHASGKIQIASEVAEGDKNEREDKGCKDRDKDEENLIHSY